jgi:hypothetical protein
VDPTSQGVGCAVDGFDAYTASVLNMLTRMYAPYLVLFFLYIEWHGARNLCNVAVLAAVGTISLCGTEDEEHRVSPDCADYMKNSLIANVVGAWLVFFFAFIDHVQTWWRRSAATARPESQPLI